MKRSSSARSAIRNRLHHLLGRCQRRCEQVRVERAGLGSEGRRAADSARVQPLLHRCPLTPIRSRRACWRSSATGGVRSRPTRRSTRRSSSSRQWSATAAPRDLRNWRFQQALYRAYYDALRAQPAAARDGDRGARARAAARGDARRIARRRSRNAARDSGRGAGSSRRRLASARLHARRGALSEHPAAAERRAVRRHRRRPRRDARQSRNAAERQRLARCARFAEAVQRSTRKPSASPPSTASSAGPIPDPAATTTTSAIRRGSRTL